MSRPSNNILKLLLVPRFLVFSLSVVFSQIAFNMLNIILIVLTYNITHSNFAVSLLIMAMLLPQVFFSFLAGIIADAKNKRKILIFGNIARALILVLFFFVKDILAFIYIFEFLISLITQFYIPAEAPIIPHLVRKDKLFAANAVFGVCLFGSILIGYVSAGPAMRLFGTSGVFLFIAFLYALSFLFIQLMPDVAPAVKKLRTEKTFAANTIRMYRLVFQEFQQVMHLLNEQKNVASSLIFLALSQVIILMLATLVPDFAQKTLHVPAEDISLVIFAPAAAGMLITSFFIGSRFTRSSEEKLISVGIFMSSIVLFLFAVIDLQRYLNVVTICVCTTFFAGVANALIFVPAQTILTRNVSRKNLSKVFGLLFFAVGVLAFVPIILAGVFADVLGVRAVLLGIGLLLLILGSVKVFFFKNRIV